jgi:hypothetical protein
MPRPSGGTTPSTAPYKYAHKIEFTTVLLKTIRGKIRWVELREREKGVGAVANPDVRPLRTTSYWNRCDHFEGVASNIWPAEACYRRLSSMSRDGHSSGHAWACRQILRTTFCHRVVFP